MKLKLFSLLLFLSILSCSKKENNKVNTDNIKVDVVVDRFDQKFYTTSPENLSDLKNEFPFLFPEPNPDSVWINKMQNKDEQDLFAESQKLYADFSSEKEQLSSLFKHIKYYYSEFKEPKVITVLTNVDYEHNVILADDLLFISLDIFLGKKNEIYDSFPSYVKQNYTKEHLIVAVAEPFAKQLIPPLSDKSFVARMIQEGKKLAMMQAFLPNVDEAEILGYTTEQLMWAEKSEVEIWKYFIQNLMLHSTDPELSKRFIIEAPFSKFFLEIDKESPGKIGVWFGWQIVQSYMKNNKISIQEMMVVDNQEIFNQSKYKPKKR
ncbi:MAG: gliding motility lipoprotein GldB [Flavobacteriaceae bacterium]|nr:gliding motility lipoprotein GldB [Flavobacteriaceae bacterium]